MNIYLDSIGCRLNQSEIETYSRQFRAAGHTLVATPDQADLVVVNTCTVTAAADSDSRQKIRQAARAGASQIVATGCWATLNPRAASALSGVSHVIPNLDKERLVPDVLEIPPGAFDYEFVEREPVPGARLRTRAFIKVQDGCDNRCTYCVTTLARGPGKSKSIPAVLADVHAALSGGAKEIVLTGVHLGSWGHDLTPTQSLDHLIRVILRETRTPRLRLSSLEPWDLSADFFDLWQDPRVCRHLHLPLQSGCGAVLRRMARKTTPESYARLVEAARAAIPDVAITTDMIAGFPGESEAEFAESLAFVETMQFAGGHVFTFSARPGTAASRYPQQVPHAERKERNARVREVLDKCTAAYQARFLDQKVNVLWECVDAIGSQECTLKGLTDNYVRVSSKGSQHYWNQITPVHLTSLTKDGLSGRIVPSPPRAA